MFKDIIMRFRILFLLTFVGLLFYSETWSKNFSHILIKGSITEETTQKPIGVEIEFRDSEGKRIKSLSNSLTGEFQQILNSNSEYTVILNSNEILRKEFRFRTLDTNDYAEQEIDWTVVKPQPGAIIFRGGIFGGDNNFTKAGLEKLEEIQMILRFNRELHVDFRVNNTNQSDATTRIASLEKHIEKWNREKGRIHLKSDKNTGNHDLIVVITKVKEFIRE